MSSGLYSGVSGLAIGTGLYRNVTGLWSGASGLITGWGGGGGGGTTPSLVLNLLSGPLDPRVTFSRSSTATYFNSAGVITLAAINEARFDYYPTTLLERGLLLEGARTNVLLNSLIDGTSLSTQSVTVTAQAYTLSFYGTGQIVLSGAASATVTGSGAFPSRTTYTFTPSAGSLTLTVTGTVGYAQLEAGSFASSFIPTAGTAVTRAADSAAMTGTNFSSWYGVLTGSVVLGAEPMFGTTSANPSALMFRGYSNYQTMYINGTSQAISYAVGTGNLSMSFVTQTYSYTTVAPLVNLASSTAPQAVVYGQAIAYAVNDFADSGNGLTPNLDTSGDVPTGVNTMVLGPTDNTYGYSGWFGWLRGVTAYTVRLSNSTLADLSSAAVISPASLSANFLSGTYMVRAIA